MSTQTRKSSKGEPGQSGQSGQSGQQGRSGQQEHRFVNPMGTQVKTREEAYAADQESRDVSAEALQTDAKLRLHNGATTFELEVRYNPNTYPFVITGGRVVSGICGAPWEITGGSMGQQLRITAKRTSDTSCAATLIILGEYQNPPSYRGTYGFNGASTTFRHTTRYQV
ncbi:hypothetical protein [Streptomyces sp. NPDC058657]|uniref:hypothetical protein n=1 Tax=unclassified Streptomyces TaxID=2593676 RepID=UPI00366957FB